MKYRDWVKARDRLMEKERGHPEHIWYLSFVGGHGERPRFLGGCMVRACGFGHAVEAAHKAGCSPGGEVVGVMLPEGIGLPEQYLNRLMLADELNSLAPLIGPMGPKPVPDEWKN